MRAPFPPGFFDRADPSPDASFYDQPRLVTHIDDGAIEAVGRLYAELVIDGRVLDLMSSWVSHFQRAPEELVGLGMNERELAANPELKAYVVQDLNDDPLLPFNDASFDHVVCCVSIDYLVRPLAVFTEVARVLRPGGLFVCTFSNRCFPTKAIRGWLASDDAGRVGIVRRYFELTDGFEPPSDELRTGTGGSRDPLYGVWAAREALTGPGTGPALRRRIRPARECGE